MDFGDILATWEKQTRSGTSSNPASTKKPHPIDTWLQNNTVHDKDAQHADTEIPAQEKHRLLRNKKPDAELDIHGLTRDEAWLSLQAFFTESKNKGLEKILIIHGKGNHSKSAPVLKRAVMDFIERCPFAGASGQEKTAAGGKGATWVLLK